jgi:hypothetical protein
MSAERISRRRPSIEPTTTGPGMTRHPSSGLVTAGSNSLMPEFARALTGAAEPSRSPLAGQRRPPVAGLRMEGPSIEPSTTGPGMTRLPSSGIGPRQLGREPTLMFLAEMSLPLANAPTVIATRSTGTSMTAIRPAALLPGIRHQRARTVPVQRLLPRIERGLPNRNPADEPMQANRTSRREAPAVPTTTRPGTRNRPSGDPRHRNLRPVSLPPTGPAQQVRPNGRPQSTSDPQAKNLRQQMPRIPGQDQSPRARKTIGQVRGRMATRSRASMIGRIHGFRSRKLIVRSATQRPRGSD